MKKRRHQNCKLRHDPKCAKKRRHGPIYHFSLDGSRGELLGSSNVGSHKLGCPDSEGTHMNRAMQAIFTAAAQGFQLPEFYSGATDRLGCFTEGFLLRRLEINLEVSSVGGTAAAVDRNPRRSAINSVGCENNAPSDFSPIRIRSFPDLPGSVSTVSCGRDTRERPHVG